ncbi:GTP-binding protein Rhes-like isoform X2 [Pecten maximus]|uniref:GTP-binding protein Rhes-like isoform X2 n=1 Tax=Pecten maximus TaxID=6579 RepID=UPI0014589FDD|nr:GTP-binding protein Rhes-like isoform X2 [Pecten maximus]
MDCNGITSRPWNLHISTQDSTSGNPDNLEGNCLCWAPNFTTPKMALIEQGDSAPPENCQRLVVLGSSKVGKTSLVARFLYNKFDDNYTPTIEDFHRKVYRIKGEAYRLDLLDTSGNHPFPAMRRLSMITGDLFVLVYSIDNRDSFEEVSKLCKQIQECKSQCRKETKRLAHVPMMIVGNKCDKDKNRVIDPSEPEMLREAYHHCGFLETSAKKNINVEESFQTLFDLAKLPVEMSPSLHRRVQPSYIGGNSSQSGKRGMSIRRKMSDACGTIAPNVRRPSIRTDLLVAQMRTNAGSSAPKVPANASDRNRTELRCVIQ